MKLSISSKIIMLATVPLVVVSIVSSLASAVFLGSSTLDEIEKELRISAYALQKETQSMSAENTSMESVDALLKDFKEKNGIDVTIFGSAVAGDKCDVRLFSTVPDAVGTNMDSGILNDISDGSDYFSKNANVNGEKYYAFYQPVMENGKYVGAFFAGSPAARVDKMIIDNMVKMILINLFCTLIMSVSSYFVARKIGGKLNRLKAAIEPLTKNDLTHEVVEYEVIHDEIEEINNQLGVFSRNLSGMMKDVGSAGGVLESVAADLNIAIEDIANHSNEIAHAMKNVADGAESQAQDTQDVTERIAEMGKSIDSITADTTALMETAARMLSVKDVAMVDVTEVSSISETLKSDVSEVNEQIAITSKSVENIRQFITVIKNIAAQINLLSFNASIEAARAGDSGRGFAVVASEIRTLAEQSAVSSNEIESSINILLGDYELIVEKMSTATHNISEQSEKIARTEKSFIELESGIKSTTVQIESITTATDKLNKEKVGVIDTVCSLSAISEENSAATEQVTAGVEELKSIIFDVSEKSKVVDESAKELATSVSVFTLP